MAFIYYDRIFYSFVFTRSKTELMNRPVECFSITSLETLERKVLRRYSQI
jgi:hypothetical protein